MKRRGEWKGSWSRGSVTTGCFGTEITLSRPQSLSLMFLCVCMCFCCGCLSFGYIHNTNRRAHSLTHTLVLFPSPLPFPKGTSGRLLLHSINQWWPPVKTRPVTVCVSVFKEGADERDWDRLNKRLTVLGFHVVYFPLVFSASVHTQNFTAHILWVWDK